MPPPIVAAVTVTALTRELKSLIEGRFLDVAVQGELSNFRPAASGHLYFTLKDAGAAISAILFRNEAMRLTFRPADGMAICAEGRLSLYEPRGQYQIVCSRLTRLGKGDLAQAFERLKARLLEEGLFDAARKRPIPFLPTRIGLVTSLAGAALHDFTRVLHQRFGVPVLLAPSSVQGEVAPRELIAALRRLEHSGLVDVIVLTRGGGSIEDLCAFNDEGLARAIAACRVPVVSAVGHEVDVTIADFVADLRAATPTDAAKTLAPVEADLRRDLGQRMRRLLSGVRATLLGDRAQLHALSRELGDPRHRLVRYRLDLGEREDRLVQSMRCRIDTQAERLLRLSERLDREHPRARLARSSARLNSAREALFRLEAAQSNARRACLADRWSRLRLASPAAAIRAGRSTLAALDARLRQAMRAALSSKANALHREVARLDALSPFAVLSRGYALAFRASDGALLKTASDAAPGEPIELTLSDRSQLKARVEMIDET
ncbi:MAG: exodeoxyribonuclease VII large subunit [Myxococcales bacterium]|nr:exodeoxyribonuclease VII large subunit [Myxococcales bacterium]